MASSRLVGPNRIEGVEFKPHCLTAQLRTALASYRVCIRDLSSLGARVEAERLPAPGMIVCLQRGAAAVFGAMAWNENGQGGILFDEELEAQLFGSELEGGPATGTASGSQVH